MTSSPWPIARFRSQRLKTCLLAERCPGTGNADTRFYFREYISKCAALIKRHKDEGDQLSDTIREADQRAQASSGKVYFLGNGDCYSHVDYERHLQEAKVDSVMVARGALIKPWIFEEIEKGQYIDKSATERLAMAEQYVRYGLETWGSDEMGVGQTRRFLLEWLSFAYRYVPVGILEHLPPSLQDRPPAWRGRNDLETLLGKFFRASYLLTSESPYVQSPYALVHCAKVILGDSTLSRLRQY